MSAFLAEHTAKVQNVFEYAINQPKNLKKAKKGLNPEDLYDFCIKYRKFFILFAEKNVG